MDNDNKQSGKDKFIKGETKSNYDFFELLYNLSHTIRFWHKFNDFLLQSLANIEPPFVVTIPPHLEVNLCQLFHNV